MTESIFHSILVRDNMYVHMWFLALSQECSRDVKQAEKVALSFRDDLVTNKQT
jgi:hypothetical protein